MASLQELLAASALIVTCERICTLGFLAEDEEQSLRRLIVKACNAFEISTLAERDPAQLAVIMSEDFSGPLSLERRT